LEDDGVLLKSRRSEWQPVFILLRWRSRLVRNSLATDAGFLGVAVGGLLYLAIVTVVALQARTGALLSSEVSLAGSDLGLRLLGIHLMAIVIAQGGALFFFRVSLQGDFTTERWRILPVDRRALRRTALVDSFLNPGAVAALIAGWLLAIGFIRPTDVGALALCLLLAPCFVYLNQSTFILIAEVLTRYRSKAWWVAIVIVATIGLSLSGYVVMVTSAHTPLAARSLAMGRPISMLLLLPPWGPTLAALARIASRDYGMALALLAAGAAFGTAMLSAANRLATASERRR
jgi:hypothetical protein